MTDHDFQAEAAERVAHFLRIRSGMSGYGDAVTGVGDPDNDGNQVDLTIADLEALVRAVLPDAVTVDEKRRRRMEGGQRAAAATLARALREQYPNR